MSHGATTLDQQERLGNRSSRTRTTESAETAVLDLVDEVRRRALETERGRVVPEDLARKLGAAGAFHFYVPPHLGGQPVDPMTACTLIEALSRADASTGWTTLILNTTFFTSWLEPDAARAMLQSDPHLGMAGQFAPIGRTERADNGTVVLSGRYPFNSGSPLATWFCEGAFVNNGDSDPAWRFLFVPASEVEIRDTWYAGGLRGTASHEVAIHGAVVPPEHTANPIFERARSDEPHFRWSFFALLASLIAGFPLGVARRALDEFIGLADHHSRSGAARLATEDLTHLELARCEALLRAARCFVLDSLAAAWETALAGDEITGAQRVAIRLATANAVRAGIETVDMTVRLAGACAVYDDHPLQRCWRDLHAGSSHVFFSNHHAAQPGRLLLAQPADEWLT